jgi:4-oxalocrotonate tautomerase
MQSASIDVRLAEPGMPYINVQITKGARRAQKEQLVAEFTDALVRILGKKPEHTHIVIQEIADEDWGFAGVLTDTYRQGLMAKSD